MSKIAMLEPTAVWQEFDKITQVPRPSKKEEKIIEYLEDFARDNNLEYKKDKIGNITILKSATESKASSPAVILQSHMDMVCEKNSGVAFDFANDPIRTKIEEGWVKAEGTTLGADDGIGMAAALAVLKATDIEHPPIEALFTVDEETGLTGAFNLGRDMISGKYLINLDSEDEGEIFIGCAGGIGTSATFAYQPVETPDDYIFFRVDVSGLMGGHSGDDIEKGRANSNKILARLLWEASKEMQLALAGFDGGNLHNAIPREANATFGVPVKLSARFFEIFGEFESGVKAEYQYTDKGLDLAVSEVEAPPAVIDPVTQSELLMALVGVPNGVIAMSGSMPGLVETSSNLASVKMGSENTILVVTSQRSSLDSAKKYIAAAVSNVFDLAGAEVKQNGGYPGWTPNPNSHLLDLTKQSYAELFSTQPKVRAIHAGLECGLFLQKYPHLEMVSFGPTLRGVHSPDEKLEIASVDKFWKLLITLLGKI